MPRDAETIDDILGGLTRAGLAPVYLLYGEEDFLVDEGVQKIVDTALAGESRGFNLDVFSGNDADAAAVVAAASAFPMMGDRRVVVVREADKFSAKDLEILDAYLQNPSPSNCLVLGADKPDMRKKPFAALKKSGRAFACKPLYENQVPAWLARRVKQQGREIDPEAAKLLSAYVGSSLRDLQNELDKLLAYAGANPRITEDDVAAVVGKSKEYSIFELQKAVGAKDAPRALMIAGRMIEHGEGMPFIVVMLTTYFTTLWKLHELRRKGTGPRELAAAAKVNPYFLREYTEALDQYSPEEVDRAFGILADADEQIKTTAGEPRLAAEVMLLRLTGVAERAPS